MATAREVAARTALLEAAETSEEVADIFRRLNALGPEGALLREAILAPALEQAVREGLIEATGERGPNGQMIYRRM
jgi:hypothetical protein